MLPSPEDEDTFRGAIPQPADWLRAWRACRCPMSYRTAELFGVTESFIQGRRGRPAVSRKAFAAMVEVMALVLRGRLRERLRRAHRITLVLDDRGPYRLIRYKCDAPCPEGELDWPGGIAGCLGVLRRGGVAASRTVGDLDDDHSQAMAESVVLALRRVAHVPGVGVDEAFFESVKLKVHIGLADGGAPVQKCLRFLATSSMPNMRLVSRDRAHAARISTQDPLLAEPTFGAWWNDTFGDKHALVPDMRNSEEWREKLLVCQRAVLQEHGSQGGGVAVCARVLSFAKQRFDSCASPQRQLCCMLSAVAMVLAYQASDTRNPPAVRARAQRRLLELPGHVLSCGVAASYSEECLRFVRLFDVHDHDPALTARELRNFIDRMQTLFLEGHIFVEPEGVGAGITDTCLNIALRQAKESQRQKFGSMAFPTPTITQIRAMHGPNDSMIFSASVISRCGLCPNHRSHLPVLGQSASFDACGQDTPTIHFGDGHVVHLYQKPSKEKRQALARSVHAVVETCLDRLRAEFAPEALDMCFDVFDVAEWRTAFEEARSGNEMRLIRLRRHARRFAEGWNLDRTRAVRELESAAHILVTTRIQKDNRVLWARTLEPDFERHGLNHTLPDMVRIYVAALDTTGAVERGLGTLTHVLAVHSGPLDEDGENASQLCEILLNGPSTEHELATDSQQDLDTLGRGVAEWAAPECTLIPTALTREFAQLWVALHGRRFRIYKPQKRGEQPKRPGTLASVARRTAAGLDALVKAAKRAPPADDHKTILGPPRAQFMRRPDTPNPVLGTKKLAKFRALTRSKIVRVKALEVARATARTSGANPYCGDTFNPHKKLRLGQGFVAAPASAPILPTLAGSQALRVVNVTRKALPALPPDAYKYDIRAPTLKDMLEADLFVWVHAWELDRSNPDADFLKSACVVEAMGKCVLGLAHWSGRQPHRSASVVQYAAAVETVSSTLVLVEPLVSKHRSMCSVIEKCGALPRSRWQVLRGSPTGAKHSVVTLACLHDVRVFLQSARRLRSKGCSGGYFPRNAA